jgi:glycosyltransferase involved in cell wall biosynthesis
MGQTPPPWHGQAVATQILFDHEWPGFEVHRLRMEFSEEMVEVGRFQWKKITHLFHLIREAGRILQEHPGSVLFYPPASAKWIPFIRDIVFLSCVRHLAGSTVFIFHASGLPVFCQNGILRRILSRMAYHDVDVALEVAQELVPPHEVFRAKSWQWCPCGIDVPDRDRPSRVAGSPMVVLYVGSLQEGKGVLEILRTATILKKQGRENEFRFRLVGKWFSNDFEDEVRHLRSEHDLEDMVELAGQLTGDDKWDAYFQSDVFFFPTHYESEATPIVLMEALGAGLPVLSTEWAGIPAMLDGCPTARLLPVKSPEAYADALIKFSGELTDTDESSHASRKFYQENFLPARFIERVEKAFLDAHALQGGAPESIQESGDRNQGAEDCSGGVSPSLDTKANAQPSTVIDRRYNPQDDSSAPTVTDRRYRSPSEIQNSKFKIAISVYLADQNPGHDRSFGISRMSQVVLRALDASGSLEIETVVSKTSQQAPGGVGSQKTLPWGTRGKGIRLLTDHLHPLFHNSNSLPEIHYFPKGYLPLLHQFCSPSVVTIHDTIIQYDEDHYPKWRRPWEYAYWSWLLRHTLRHADRIMTVSESSKRQIQGFMSRHGIPSKEITVTYEPCAYEELPQPEIPSKDSHVIHLASREPHKRTAHLVRWWHEAEKLGRNLPTLHLIGTVPPEVEGLLASSRTIVKRPFLDDSALQAAYLHARALILPSEIEGFGLPALEAYYLGTPVCYVKGTSVEEVLAVTTGKGGFVLDEMETLLHALDEVMAMPAEEIRQCGLMLRETYAAEKVAQKMLAVFNTVENRKYPNFDRELDA